MVGSARDASSSDIAAVREFVQGTQARRSQAKKDLASGVVAGVLSAALFSRAGKRR